MSFRRKIAGMDPIGKYFNKRLATVFAGVAPNPLMLRYTQGAPLFLLCFAAANPRRRHGLQDRPGHPEKRAEKATDASNG